MSKEYSTIGAELLLENRTVFRELQYAGQQPPLALDKGRFDQCEWSGYGCKKEDVVK